MKFLKFSVVILFLLSLASAGATLYLSTIRENEKEKRIYLEGVRSELEGRVDTLEAEKTELERKVTDLDFQNQDLSKKLNDERAARTRSEQQTRQKDAELQTLRIKSTESAKAFQNAEKRNRELERVLNDLESRLKEMETRQAAPVPETAFVELKVTPPASSPAPPPVAAAPKEEVKAQAVETQKSPAKPAAEPPKLPVQRKWFPFLGGKDKKGEKAEAAKPEPKAQVQVKETVKAESAKTVPPAPPAPIPRALIPAAPVQVKEKTQAVPKADQAISAGRVLLVNRKFNFIVVNLGTRQGLALDDVLTVQKDGKTAAKVRVEKLYDDYSAAYIVEEQSGFPIGEQDVVMAV